MAVSGAPHHHVDLDTLSGRHLHVGALPMRGLPHLGRVTLQVGCESFDREQMWLSLRPDEARRLADALLQICAWLDDVS